MTFSAVECAASSVGAVGSGIGRNVRLGWLCSPGCGECIRQALVVADINRRKLPDYTAYVGDDYPPYRYMITLLDEARGVGNWVPHGSLNGVCAPAAVSRVFKDKRIKLGVANLHGCTSVIVVSKMGIWASHFWEVPCFKTWVGPGQYDFAHFPDKFKRDVLDTFDYGCAFDQHPDGGCEGVAYHTRNDSSMFAEKYEPRIIIVTPREKTLWT
ncbi:hypothetical protein IMZ48_26290, partial [Candidatus Bathyarchaeota archaeon]|nr:hypothetical protein [Candidatus Bathyarchaeota archaeon]